MGQSHKDLQLKRIAAAIQAADQAFRSADFPAAEPTYSQSLPLLEKMLGPDHPDTVDCLQKFADTTFAMGRYEVAVGLYKRLAAIGERFLGSTHPEVIKANLKLARTCELAGDLLGADGAMKQTGEWSIDPRLAGKASGVANRSEEEAGRASQQTVPVSEVYKNRSRDYSDARMTGERHAADIAHLKRSTEPIEEQPSGTRFQAKAVVLPVLALVVLVVLFAFVWITMPTTKSDYKGQPPAGSVAASGPRPSSSYFSSPDDLEWLHLEGGNTATIRIGRDPVKVTYTTIGGSWQDLFQMLVGSIMYKEIWFQEVPEGLREENGPLLYGKDEPEQRIISKMHVIGQRVSLWYQAMQSYPKTDDQLRCSDTMYTNPFTFKIETPILQTYQCLEADANRIVDGVFADNLEHALQISYSGMWKQEAPPSPGAIHCLSVVRNANDSKTYEFFIHGFDRNGHLLTGSAFNSAFLLAFKNGSTIAPLLPSSIFDQKLHRPVRVCLVSVPKNFDIHLMHYCWPIIFVSVAVLFGAAAGFGSAIASQTKQLKIVRLVALLVALAFAALAVIAFSSLLMS